MRFGERINHVILKDGFNWQKANVVSVTQQVNNVRSYLKTKAIPISSPILGLEFLPKYLYTKSIIKQAHM